MTTPPQEPLVPPSAGHPSVVASHPPPAGAGVQDPYATPWHQPPASSPAWGGPDQRALQEAEAALRRSRTAFGWAIGATVGAFLALVIAVIALVGAGLGAAEDLPFEPLRGEVVGLPDGAALSGERLQHNLVDLLREYGSDGEVTCPDTASVTTSTAVVCTGTVDDLEWTGIVFFEDAEGTFVVVEV